MVYKFAQGYSITLQNMIAMVLGLIWPKLYILGQNSQILWKKKTQEIGKKNSVSIFVYVLV